MSVYLESKKRFGSDLEGLAESASVIDRSIPQDIKDDLTLAKVMFGLACIWSRGAILNALMREEDE